jgi:predicted transcriptional regulator
MTPTLKDVLVRAESWPDWAQQELTDLALEIDREVQVGIHQATLEELRKIDAALAAVRHGEIVTDEEVEAVLTKERGT